MLDARFPVHSRHLRLATEALVTFPELVEVGVGEQLLVHGGSFR